MSSNAEKKAASIAGPRAAADPTGRYGQYRYASTTVSDSEQLLSDAATGLPHAFRGNIVRVMSRLVNTQVAFSEAPQVLVINQPSVLGTGSAAAGWTILAGTWQDIPCPASCEYMNFISDGVIGAGYVEFYLAEEIERA